MSIVCIMVVAEESKQAQQSIDLLRLDGGLRRRTRRSKSGTVILLDVFAGQQGAVAGSRHTGGTGAGINTTLQVRCCLREGATWLANAVMPDVRKLCDCLNASLRGDSPLVALRSEDPRSAAVQ